VTEARRKRRSPAVGADDFATWLKDKTASCRASRLARWRGRSRSSCPRSTSRTSGPRVPARGRCQLHRPARLEPGVKTDDGKDLERFDAAFLAERFATDRVGKTASKFDRDKLLAFNADTIQHGMDDGAFASRWLAWAERFDPDLAAWAHADADRWVIAARAARPRAKTLRDARGAIAFALHGDDGFEYDGKAVKKGLLKGEPNGLALLPDIRSLIE
jgi:hypothetical protein